MDYIKQRKGKGEVIATCVKTGSQTEFKYAQRAKESGFKPSEVSKCLNGLEDTHFGHTFKYKDNREF